LIFKLNNADLNDLIHIQFREKKETVHSNYVAKTFNFLHILSIMLPGIVKNVKTGNEWVVIW